MIYLEKPDNFTPKFEVVSCFAEAGSEILMLHRQDHKPEGGTWGIPTGKVDPQETLMQAMLRELWEETGLKVAEHDMKYFARVFVRYPDYDFIYHMFYTKVGERPEIVINEKEHNDYRWAIPELAIKLPLIQDLDECIRLFYY